MRRLFLLFCELDELEDLKNRVISICKIYQNNTNPQSDDNESLTAILIDFNNKIKRIHDEPDDNSRIFKYMCYELEETDSK